MPTGMRAENSDKRKLHSPMLLFIVLAVIVVALAAFFIASPIGTHTGRHGTTNQWPNTQQ